MLASVEERCNILKIAMETTQNKNNGTKHFLRECSLKSREVTNQEHTRYATGEKICPWHRNMLKVRFMGNAQKYAKSEIC